MTDDSTSTAEAKPDAAPNIGFTVEQLQFLLSLAPGTAADTSAEIFDVAPLPSAAEALVTGGASLFARGELEITNTGTFVPVDAALVIGYILTAARRWTLVTGASDSAADIGVYIESDQGAVVAQPRTLGTWWFIILDPAVPAADAVNNAVLGMALLSEESGVVAQLVTDTLDRTFTVRRRSDEWAFAYGDTDGDVPEVTRENVSQDEVSARVREFVLTNPTEWSGK